MDEEKSFDEEISERDIEQKRAEQIVVTQPVKVNGNKGKPKSEAWKQKMKVHWDAPKSEKWKEAMKLAHDRKKAKLTQVA